ncbi:MAG: hypothetical protein WKF41_05495 [Gaiellaceae bacterium]
MGLQDLDGLVQPVELRQQAESARNNTGWQGKVATGYNGSGSQQTHNAGGYFYSLGSVFNNQVSSYCLSSC